MARFQVFKLAKVVLNIIHLENGWRGKFSFRLTLCSMHGARKALKKLSVKMRLISLQTTLPYFMRTARRNPRAPRKFPSVHKTKWQKLPKNVRGYYLLVHATLGTRAAADLVESDFNFYVFYHHIHEISYIKTASSIHCCAVLNRRHQQQSTNNFRLRLNGSKCTWSAIESRLICSWSGASENNPKRHHRRRHSAECNLSNE